MRTSQIIAAVALGWTAAAFVVGGLVVAGRESAVERGNRDTATLALVLEENTARTFEAVDIALSATADAFAPALAKHHPAFQKILEQRLADLPSARAIFIIGPDGHIVHGTNYPTTPLGSLADRPYFMQHQADPTPRLAISAPLESRAGLGWFLAASRPVLRDGKFAGVVVAAVQPGYFESLYRRMQLREGDVITLYTDDGVIIATHPAGPERIGTSFADRPPFTPPFANLPAGTYVSRGSTLDADRTASFRRIERLPFVVEIARSRNAILAEWRRTAYTSGVAMLALTLLLVPLLAYLLRQRRLRDIARARRAQADKLEALGLLTGGIAHDFGNLLNIVSMNLHLIGIAPASSDATRQAVAVARRAVDRGKELIARLLAFAKQQPLDVRPADLNTLVAEAGPLLRQAAGSGVDISTELAQGLAPCLVDSNQIEVALVNLVVNARDAMAGRAAPGRIVLRTYNCTLADIDFMERSDRRTGYVGLAVEDNGPGMSDELRRRAIEPFFSTKGATGTGLGLPQVYGFMHQIGGSVRIDSEPGNGTTVHLFFPIAPPSNVSKDSTGSGAPVETGLTRAESPT